MEVNGKTVEVDFDLLVRARAELRRVEDELGNIGYQGDPSGSSDPFNVGRVSAAADAAEGALFEFANSAASYLYDPDARAAVARMINGS
jgi:hypothetical protein